MESRPFTSCAPRIRFSSGEFGCFTNAGLCKPQEGVNVGFGSLQVSLNRTAASVQVFDCRRPLAAARMRFRPVQAYSFQTGNGIGFK
jgi:hypothetical protein